MAVKNPLYNPDWQRIHDHHDAERIRLDTELTRLIRAEGDPEEIARLEEEFDKHHDACLQSFKMQHPTIQDYARWLLENFPHGNRGVANVHFSEDVIEAFISIEEVNQHWAKTNTAIKTAEKRWQKAAPSVR